MTRSSLDGRRDRFVFSGLDGTDITGFYAYDPAFSGGVFVAD